MAGGKEHADERISRATGHGWRNRKHRGSAGEQGISARPIRRPENTAGGVVAMAGDAEVGGARG